MSEQSLLPPSSPPEALPLWHRDIAAIAPLWADEAAQALQLLAQSDARMVQANSVGLEGQNATLAYATLLAQMKGMEKETIQQEKESWWDNLHKKFLGKQKPLLKRMQDLMQARHLLIQSTRERIHGLREALDMRAQADEMAEKLLEKAPPILEAAQHESEQALRALAQVDREDYEAFRHAQARVRALSNAPQSLKGVCVQLQNALSLGLPLRDSLERFVHIEEMNQSQFELAFGAQVSQLAVLQGMQQSQINAQASQAALGHMAPSGNDLALRFEKRRIVQELAEEEKKVAYPVPTKKMTFTGNTSTAGNVLPGRAVPRMKL